MSFSVADFRLWMADTAPYATLAAIACLPFSKFWMNQFLITAVVFSFFGGLFGQYWQYIKQRHSTYVALAFFTWIWISVIYSAAPNFLEALQGVGKYGKILYILVLLPIFLQPFIRQWAELLLIASIFISTLFNLAYAYDIWHIRMHLEDYFIFNTFLINPIYITVQTTFVAFLCFTRFFTHEKYKYLFLALFILFSFYLLFINPQRTAYLLYLSLTLLVIFQNTYCNWKKILFSSLFLCLFLFSVYHLSPQIHHNVHETITEVLNYQEDITQGQYNSTNYRLSFLLHSWDIFIQHPWLGTGAGSFSYVYAQTNGPSLYENKLLDHPHNEYMMVMLQFGLVGLSLFLVWIITHWRWASELSPPNKFRLQALIIIFVLNGLANVSLFSGSTGSFYLLFLALYSATWLEKKL